MKVSGVRQNKDNRSKIRRRRRIREQIVSIMCVICMLSGVLASGLQMPAEAKIFGLVSSQKETETEFHDESEMIESEEESAAETEEADEEETTPVSGSSILVTADEVNVREWISLDAEVVALAQQGDVLPLLGIESDGEYDWYLTVIDGVEGYIRSDLAKITDEEAAEEPETETESEIETESESESEAAGEAEAQELTYSDDTVVITARGAIPAGTTLRVVPITEDDPRYSEVWEQLGKKAEDEEYDIAGFVAYDICFVDADGNEVEPDDDVVVTMDYKKPVMPQEAQDYIENAASTIRVVDEDDNEEIITPEVMVGATVMHLEEDSEGNVVDVVDMSQTNQINTMDTTAEGGFREVEVVSDNFSIYANTVTAYSISGGTQVEVDKTITLTSDQGGNWTDSWSTSDDKVATVSGNGKTATVKGVKPGTVTITHKWRASFQSQTTYSETINVTVVAAPKTMTVKFFLNKSNKDSDTRKDLVTTITVTTDAEGNVTIPLKDATALAKGKNGNYTFFGWSTLYKEAYDATGVRYTGDYIKLPSSDFTNNNLNMFAVWCWPNSNDYKSKIVYYTRLDGKVPYEPAHYPTSEYTKGIQKDKSVRYYNHIYNDLETLYANFTGAPSAEDIAKDVNDSNVKFEGQSIKLVAQNGKLYKRNANGTPDLTQEFYVQWYVLKYDGPAGDPHWHVDGALLRRNKWTLHYDANSEGALVENIIPGLQYPYTEQATVHNTFKNNTQVDDVPVRIGYTFVGWNTEPDGSGTAYKAGDKIWPEDETVTDVWLYAQWSKWTLHYHANAGNDPVADIIPDVQYPYEEKAVVHNTYKLNEQSNEYEQVDDYPHRTGYKFTGWNTKANGGGTSYQAQDLIGPANDTITDVDLYGQWTELSVKEDTPYIQVAKTFVNIDDPETEFPNYTITIKNTKTGETATVGWNNTLTYVNGTYIWTIKDVSTGTYLVTESNYKDAGYTVVATDADGNLLLNDSVNVTTQESSTTFGVLEYFPSCNKTTIQLNSVPSVIVARLDPSINEFFVWTEYALSAAEREKLIKDIINAKWASTDGKTVTCHYFSGDKISDEGGLDTEDGNVRVDKAKKQLIFERTKMWEQFATGSMVRSDKVDAEIELNNAYYQLKLLKADENGDPLAGAEFTFENTSTSVNVNSPTGADGVIYEGPLPKAGSYTLSETQAPQGYLDLANDITIEVEEKADHTFVVKADTMEITPDKGVYKIQIANEPGYKAAVTKNWIGQEASSVIAGLYDGTTLKAVYTLNAGEFWTHTFVDLAKPVSTDGYTFKEVVVDPNGTAVEGSTDTTKYSPVADGAITAIDSVNYKVTYGAAQYDDTNRLYSGEITNTELTDITVAKQWVDDSNAKTSRPDNLKVFLYRNDAPAAPYRTTEDAKWDKSQGDIWTYTFTNVEKNGPDDRAYTYTVDEDGNVNGLFTSDKTDADGANYTYKVTVDNKELKITNTLTGTTKVEGTKTWVDGGNAYSTRPDQIVITLYQNGNPYIAEGKTAAESVTLTANDADPNDSNVWNYSFTDLPQYDNIGKAYIYTVKEDQVAGYTAAYDDAGLNITNTLDFEWKIVKIAQGDSSKKLSGARFMLSNSADTYYAKSGSDGVLSWYSDEACTTAVSGKLADGTYSFEEIEPPTGYTLSSEKWSVEVKDGLANIPAIRNDSTKCTVAKEGSKTVIEYRYENTMIYSLPSAGGTGIYLYMISGILLMIAATLIYIKKLRGEVLIR